MVRAPQAKLAIAANSNGGAGNLLSLNVRIGSRAACLIHAAGCKSSLTFVHVVIRICSEVCCSGSTLYLTRRPSQLHKPSHFRATSAFSSDPCLDKVLHPSRCHHRCSRTPHSSLHPPRCLFCADSWRIRTRSSINGMCGTPRLPQRGICNAEHDQPR